MTPDDMLFGEIALRLQVLSREQIERCIRFQDERAPAASLREIALELGLIGEVDANLVAAQQARTLERRAASRRSLAPEARPPSGQLAPDRGETRATGEQVNQRWSTPDASPDARGTGERVNQRWNAPNAETDARATGEQVNQRWSTPDASPTGPGGVYATGEPAVSRGTPDAAIARTTGEAVNQRWGVPGTPPPTPSVAPHRPMTPTRLTTPAAPAANPGRTAALDPAPAVSPARTTAVDLAPAASPGRTTAVDATPAVSAPHSRPTTGAVDLQVLTHTMGIAFAHGASDLHLHADAIPRMRVGGRLLTVPGASALGASQVHELASLVLDDAGRDALRDRGHHDAAWGASGVGRARVSAYRQERGVDLVLHLVPEQPPALDTLGLPAGLARLVDARAGLILCTGPRGAGKSTTLAALLGAMITRRADHVVTIEDPIEHVFTHGRAFVSQREVGTHTQSFVHGLQAALREHPNILYASELRDAESIGLAVAAAETGHLVLAALPSAGTVAAIQHVVGAFPPDDREQVRAMLAESLLALIDQRLVPRADGHGRVPAVELLLATSPVRNLIRQNRLAHLHSALQSGRTDGMVTLDDALAEFVQAGTVTAEAAWRFAHRRERVATAP